MPHFSQNAQIPQPEILTKLTTLWGREFIDLQFQVLEKMVVFFNTVPGNGNEALDAWNVFYDKEVKPLLNAPQVGLVRYYQERSSHLMDKYNSWNKASLEFFSMVSGPLEKSICALQGEKAKGDRAKHCNGGSKELYQLWIERLESLYQDLLRSPDFLECLSDTLDALEGFVMARTEYVQGLGKALQLPTLKDLDEAYRELYLLKKEVRAMKKERVGKNGRKPNRSSAGSTSRKR